MKKLLIISGCLFYFFGNAQKLDYSFSKVSATYSEINDPVYIAEGGNWLKSSISIPIGFSFNYLGNKFTSVEVTPDGYISFGGNTSKFLCFGLSLDNQKDSAGQNLSSISYLTQGESGHKILKIQFKNCKVLNDTSGYINFQVRLFEGGNKIGLIVGDTRFDNNILNISSKQVGLKYNTQSVMLSGSADDPGKINSSANISGYPKTDVMYLFTPNF